MLLLVISLIFSEYISKLFVSVFMVPLRKKVILSNKAQAQFPNKQRKRQSQEWLTRGFVGLEFDGN